MQYARIQWGVEDRQSRFRQTVGIDHDMVAFHTDPGAGGAGDGGDDPGGAGGDAGGDGGDDDPAGDDDDDPELEGLSDDAKAKIRRANQQAARYRRELRDKEARLKELEDKDLSDAERTKRERDEHKSTAEELSDEVLELRLQNVLIRNADKHGIDPDVALAMIWRDVEFDDDGNPENLEQLLRQLKRSKPHLFTSDGSAGTGNGAGVNPSRRDRTDEEIDKLPLAERAAARLRRGYSKTK